MPATPSPVLPDQAPPADTARLTHERLELKDWETGCMKQLFPLIPSPRAAKRFVNVYRLLRGISIGAERREMLEQGRGGYREVLLLLAMITGYPVEGSALMALLLETEHPSPEPGSWWTWLAQHREGQPPANVMTGEADGGVSTQVADDQPDPARWKEMLEKLEQTRSAATQLSCQGLVRWAPVVARYSFASGRLLVSTA
jgi:hypothetical protein